MDQLPNELIDLIFFYLIDQTPLFRQGVTTRKTFNMIKNIRLTCRRFQQLESSLINNLHLANYLSQELYQLQQNNPFWQKYLPHVYHLDLFSSEVNDVSMLTRISSLDICETQVKDVSLPRLKQLFCREYMKLDIEGLPKTNIHYHICSDNEDYSPLYFGHKCRSSGCLIRHREWV